MTRSQEKLWIWTPYQFFKYLWMDEIISSIYEESKRYPKEIQFTFQTIEPPRELEFDRIKETMPLKIFETVRQYLHFNDKDKHLPRDHPNHNGLHKIKPLYDELNKNFAKAPLERHLSIDEQICSTKELLIGTEFLIPKFLLKKFSIKWNEDIQWNLLGVIMMYIEISVTAWKDNKTVIMASTFGYLVKDHLEK
ncbi:piggyBac transposable element-derived protein 2 [Trichonephila clavipes]|nr:piggyBac transposable element-derived protein 2 [Trichonephila clavipes]